MGVLKKCFISAPFGFDTSAIAQILDEKGTHWARLDNLAAGADISSELVRAISESDFVCAVIPSEPPSANSVMFEIGLTRGLNKPILILSDENLRVPFELGSFEIARINLSDPDTIRLHLVALMRNLERKQSPSEQKRAMPLSPVDVSALREAVRNIEVRAGDPRALLGGQEAAEIERALAECFQKAGATVSVAQADRDLGADLGIWVDSLQSVIGNPILIELKIGRFDTARIARAEQTLRAALIDAQAFAGLLIYLDTDRKSFTQKAGTYPLVFYFSIYEIMEALQVGTFVASVTERRNRAVHGRS